MGGHEHGLYFSEVIISDSDTRNARLDLLRPVSAGAYENFDGPLSSLADDDPTTGMTTTLPDQSQSTILSDYAGANNISNVVPGDDNCSWGQLSFETPTPHSYERGGLSNVQL